MPLLDRFKSKLRGPRSAASESQLQGSAKDIGDTAAEGEQLTIDKPIGPKILSDPEGQIIEYDFASISRA
jgi:hypothetical protein